MTRVCPQVRPSSAGKNAEIARLDIVMGCGTLAPLLVCDFQ